MSESQTNSSVKASWHLWVIGIVGFLWSAMGVTAFHNYVLSNGVEVVGDTFSLVFTAIIFLVGLGLYLYSKAMLSKGVLR